MKKLVLLIILCLILSSCSWVIRNNPYSSDRRIGKGFTVTVPKGITFYKEPSSKSESFYLDKPERFVVEYLECSEGRPLSACVWDRVKGVKEEIYFYRVRFEFGKIGYLMEISFRSEYIVSDTDMWRMKRAPRIHHAEYNKVWDAALSALDSLGFVITQMNKADGYITTDKRESGDKRIKVSIRLNRVDDSIMVTVSSSGEVFSIGYSMDYRRGDRRAYSDPMKSRWVSIGGDREVEDEILYQMNLMLRD